jgi:glucosamine--fructose-6-phosphate aminotransferase (isomerizing)
MKLSINEMLAKAATALVGNFRLIETNINEFLKTEIYFGRSPAGVPSGSIVFFPLQSNVLNCGIAAIVSYKNTGQTTTSLSVSGLDKLAASIAAQGFETCHKNDDDGLDEHYLGGKKLIDSLWKGVQALKGEKSFFAVYANLEERNLLKAAGERLAGIVQTEVNTLTDHMGRMPARKVELMAARVEKLKDITWCIRSEILDNLEKIDGLLNGSGKQPQPSVVSMFKKINTVLKSIDRLEVRGRDSAGISLLFVLDPVEYSRFKETLKQQGLDRELEERCGHDTLSNRSMNIHRIQKDTGESQVAVALTYKIAKEVGSLGDNIAFLRRQITGDHILQALAACPAEFDTVSAHTRWASVGAITEANCHPVDNQTVENHVENSGIIHTCLNGDIDNYQQLRREFENNGDRIPADITTDTKIIPLVIQKYYQQGHDMAEAFRLAVNDFEGSHAISMHTDLDPGKVYLGQKGSGQALFVGIADNHYIPTSEVYGFVEETDRFIKLDGETVVEGKNGPTQGQIFILDQQSEGGLKGIRAMFYDGTDLPLSAGDIKHTEITSRDIDRQDYPHYFLKEISESPDSMDKTLQNRWKVSEKDSNQYVISLDKTVIPQRLKQALEEDRIKRIFFIGQGTAGVAALACANILNYYMDNPAYQIGALKASEFSGFQLNENDAPDSMKDALVIAISQSGTTTDTNRTVDMVKERGAYTLAIVNRRDSDITFKVNGVIYTSSGRDIEMSVASTKAFYAQIVAGAVLGLYIAALKKRRNAEFVSNEIRQLLALPDHMRKILAGTDAIRESASKLAVTKTYWAAVGSGPNKASDKTISSDFVEDKKHIDLSSEPLIIVCAAGTRHTVIGDIIKDTAIFKAHKATPIVIADEGDDRFDLYADTVFHVPHVSEHLAPILNTLVGHIWGYYAALAINEGSRFLYRFQDEIQKSLDLYNTQGLDVYEIILEKPFREKIAEFYNEFRKKRAANQFPTTIGLDIASDLTLLLKYLSGRLPVSDFELDFNQKGTAINMLNTFFSRLSDAISAMARPVDAIKHQAKTVTVGTSRIVERIEGTLFDTLSAENFVISQLTNRNIIVLKNLQAIIDQIEGSVLYRIGGLSLLGEPTDETTIEVLHKGGDIADVPSRVETDNRLKGSKRIIVRQGNVYIGKGRKDNRSILVIPILSASDDSSNKIEFLMLLHVSFKQDVSLENKVKALGGKYEHVKNIVQENSIAWQDSYLELVEIEELFGRSAEKIGDFIVAQQNGKA